jgi:hypothetical protein
MEATFFVSALRVCYNATSQRSIVSQRREARFGRMYSVETNGWTISN